MSAWGYPPEPEWVGEMSVTCNAEVERRVITPGMESMLKALIEGPDDPWKPRSPLAEAEATVRWAASLMGRVIHEYRVTEPMTLTCQFEGPTEVALMQGRALWTCPMCGEEHDDESGPLVEDPDPDRLHDERRERMLAGE